MVINIYSFRRICNLRSSGFDNSPTVYSESGIQYDSNGNIVHLTRTGYTSTGAGYIDRMLYQDYTGNRLTAVRDSSGSNVLYSGGFEFRQVKGYKTTQYAYNANGSMKYDPRSGGFAIRLR